MTPSLEKLPVTVQMRSVLSWKRAEMFVRSVSLSCPASLCWPGISLRSDNDNCDQLFSRGTWEEAQKWWTDPPASCSIIHPFGAVFFCHSRTRSEKTREMSSRLLSVLESFCLQWQNEYFWEAWWPFKTFRKKTRVMSRCSGPTS